MKVSVCVPVIRRFELLEQFLCSLLMQSHKNWELILKDGCPDDPVANNHRIQLLFRLVGDDRMQYEVGNDRGIFDAFNKCMVRATGDIIYAACSDDLICPGSFEAVNAVFEKERFPTMAWLYGKTVSVDASGKRLGVDGVRTNRDEMLKRNRLGLPAVFWGRGLLGVTGFFDMRCHHSADYELYLRCWRLMDPVFLDQELGVFRHHGVNWSQSHTAELEAEVSRIQQRHRCMGDVIQSARNFIESKRAFGGHFPPDEEAR